MAAASAARPGPEQDPAACTTVRSAAALPSGQGSEGVPRAAATAVPTRQEQVHEGKPEPDAPDHVGSPDHHMGPPDHVGLTAQPDVRTCAWAATRARSPHPRGAGGVRRTRPGSAPVGMACLEPHSADRSRRAGWCRGPQTRHHPAPPRRPAAAAGRRFSSQDRPPRSLYVDGARRRPLGKRNPVSRTQAGPADGLNVVG